MIITEVKTDGLMSQLGEEIIESYDTGESGATVSDIVTELLAFQRKATQITEGTISVTGTRALDITNRSILSVLLQLQESIGGYMYVDIDRKLQWPTTIGEDTGQQIRYRKNLIGITKDIDYGGYCTKLHPSSSDESLSDISVGPVDVDKDSDASYGYLTLKETYACYKDWEGVGEDLPAHVTIYKENNAPTWKIGTNPTGAGWEDEANAVDDDWDTLAHSDQTPYTGPYAWCSYLTCDLESGFYNTCKFKIGCGGDRPKTEISVYDGADWTVIYWGFHFTGRTIEFEFAGQTITSFRVRAFWNYWDSGYLKIYECQFLQSDVTDDSSNWEQGADERTLRCAIGDYDAGADYRIAYQYANYLIAWDKITDNDDIVARVVTNKYEAYAISILEAAILLLDELKIVPITYKIRAIDLSKNEDFDFSFDALQLGSTLTVIDEEMGINVSVRVVSLVHPDLLNPQHIELDLSTRVKDISDYLADLDKRFG